MYEFTFIFNSIFKFYFVILFSLAWSERSFSDASSRDKRALSLDLDKQPIPAARRSGTRCSLHPHTSTKILVAWLENFEDHLNLPIGKFFSLNYVYAKLNVLISGDLLHCMHTGLEAGPPRPADVLIIGIHLMASGLLRIHLRGPTGRVGLASPLVDGMVVSRRALGPLVRQTALNMSRRRRLDSDRYDLKKFLITLRKIIVILILAINHHT